MKKIAILFFVCAIFAFSSCQKQKLDRLKGGWKEIDVTEVDQQSTYLWDFDTGYLNIYSGFSGDTIGMNLYDSGFYIVETNPLGTMELSIESTSSTVINDTWTVSKLTNDILILQREVTGGIFLKEFTKVY